MNQNVRRRPQNPSRHYVYLISNGRWAQLDPEFLDPPDHYPMFPEGFPAPQLSTGAG